MKAFLRPPSSPRRPILAGIRVFRHPDSTAPSTAHVVSRHRGAILHCLSDLPHAALPIISIEIGRHYCGAVRPLIWTKYSPAEKRSKRGFLSCPAANGELLIGALLAMGAISTPHTRAISELAAASGLGLIALAVFGFSNNTTFPGFAALLPSLGAAAIIWAGTVERGTVTRFLTPLRPS